MAAACETNAMSPTTSQAGQIGVLCPIPVSCT
jgi:hypothetical protein